MFSIVRSRLNTGSIHLDLGPTIASIQFKDVQTRGTLLNKGKNLAVAVRQRLHM